MLLAAFWDVHCILLLEFLNTGATLSAHHYCTKLAPEGNHLKKCPACS